MALNRAPIDEVIAGIDEKWSEDSIGRSR
jgi:hypothetical protein